MTEAVRPRIELNQAAVEHGYRNCRLKVRKVFHPYLWVAGNLPNNKKKSLETVLWHLIQCVDLFDLESPNHLPLDVWSDVRADLSDAFLDQFTSEELAALVDTVRKHNIPKQFLFDMLDGADFWIRDRRFGTYEELKVFAYRMGGAPLLAMVPILGITKPGYEVFAIRCGQAMFLTQLLANCVQNLKHNKSFLAVEDLDDCGIVIHRLKLRKGDENWTNLVRLYGSRIEKLFYEGGELINHLDFDGVRTIKSILAIHWKMLMNMTVDPNRALSEEGVLSKSELFLLRSRHLMGMEGNIPFLPENSGQTHH